jgi:hypothetical protein
MQMDEQTRQERERERRECLRQRIERRSATTEDRPPKLDTHSPQALSLEDVDRRIDEAIRGHHEHIFELLTHVTARTLDTGALDLKNARETLEAKIAKLEADIAVLRAVLITEKAEKSTPVDLQLPLLHVRA